MAKYRKKPIVVDAEIFVANQGMEDGFSVYETEYPDEGHTYEMSSDIDTTRQTILSPAIKTISGWADIQDGDYIIKEQDGVNRYPCKRHIFEATYDLAE
jgi:hypothetical protein